MNGTEHRETIERELLRVGIKPDIQITNGGHLRISFIAGSKPHTITTSKTPSDRRSTLNARARIRRILREAGVFDQPLEPTPIQKAFSLPIGADPMVERLRRLESDFDALLDMFADLASPPQRVEAAPVAEPKRRTKSDDVLLAVEYQWTELHLIVSRAGLPYATVAANLSKLKGMGKVENGKRGLWRKVNPALAPQAKGHGLNDHHLSGGIGQ